MTDAPRRSLVLLALGALLTVGMLVAVGTWFVQVTSQDLEPLPQGALVAEAPPFDQAAPARPVTGNRLVPSPTWVASISGATGIPSRALTGYAAAQLAIQKESPGCRVGWNTLAALGRIESGHGSAFGATLDASGYAQPRILGPVLDGTAFAAVKDTDQGAYDGDATWDRAVGPLQFIPSTWARWGADGNGDGRADPDQVDDAALAAARYLCHSGNLAEAETWRRAVFSYNHSDDYVADIASVANQYAQLARG